MQNMEDNDCFEQLMFIAKSAIVGVYGGDEIGQRLSEIFEDGGYEDRQDVVDDLEEISSKSRNDSQGLSTLAKASSDVCSKKKVQLVQQELRKIPESTMAAEIPNELKDELENNRQ